MTASEHGDTEQSFDYVVFLHGTVSAIDLFEAAWSALVAAHDDAMARVQIRQSDLATTTCGAAHKAVEVLLSDPSFVEVATMAHIERFHGHDEA